MSPSAPVSLKPTGAARRRYLYERIIKVILAAAAGLTVLITLMIVLSLAKPAISFFGHIGLGKFFGGTKWSPLFNPPRYGVWPIVVGTLWDSAIALLVAIPLGIGAAFYLAEYARPRVRNILKPVLEVLAGVPTVVFGFFALTFVNPNLVKKFWPIGEVGAQSVLTAGLVTGIMILPTVASLAEDAMSAVPQALRDGALAVGSAKREVCTKVVLPAALSGIAAAVVLAGSRAIGETTIALIAAGSKPTLSANPGEGAQTMAGFIGFAGTGGEMTVGSVGYNTIFGVGSLLFVITLVLNFVSIRVVRRFRQAYE